MTRRLFIDTTVLVHAYGEQHDLRERCRAIVQEAAEGSVELHASVEVPQEFLFHRLRRAARADAVAETRDVMTFCRLYPFDREVLDLSVQLVEGSGMRGRDAVHAATALVHGFEAIVSADADAGFDGIPGLSRIDPATT